MKVQHLAYLLLSWLIIVSMAQNAIALQETATAVNEELLIAQDPLAYFYQPLKFTPAGTRCFLKHIYNRPEYTYDFLPHNFSHFSQFLTHGKNTNQTRLYTRSVIKLFAQKIKATPYVNATAFSQFLAQMPELLGHHFQLEASKTTALSSKLNQLLYDTFLNRFTQFQAEPDTFFGQLVDEINSLVQQQQMRSVETQQLRHAVVRCIEAGMSKLIWSPDDQEQVWSSFKTLANNLTTIAQAGIIDEDDLDDLAWSLVHRFCYFLEHLGSYLSPSVYAQIKEDLTNEAVPLLLVEEQEKLIQSKTERLMRMVFEGEVRAYAQQDGVL